MNEKFNIFRWQIDLDYRKEVGDQVKEDPQFADDVLDALISIGEEIGIPFEFEKPKPKTRPKVWVDKGRNTWNVDTEPSPSWEVK